MHSAVRISVCLGALLTLVLFFQAAGQSEIGYFYQAYENVRTSPALAKDNPEIAKITPAQFANQVKQNTWQSSRYTGATFVVALILFILSMYQLQLLRTIDSNQQ
jgi:hypothetical protein